MQQDFNRRIAIIINKSLPVWQAMNALAHIAAHYGHYLKDNYSTGQYFKTKDNNNISRNTQYPIIVFETDFNALQLFSKEIKDLTEIEKMYFVKEMISTTNDEEIQKAIAHQNFMEIEFLGAGIFGDNSLVKKLTKRFKLWS
ncbi:MAG: DUF2000 domain-containing protein [Candidatus Thermoplasmatota archaeon]|nr:DUF2000 domain-containing protein [Candidatus Thermoplasmatota archaeon]